MSESSDRSLKCQAANWKGGRRNNSSRPHGIQQALSFFVGNFLFRCISEVRSNANIILARAACLTEAIIIRRQLRNKTQSNPLTLHE
jgi:hypothetical protein